MAEYSGLRRECELRCEEERKEGLRSDRVYVPAVEAREEMWKGTRGSGRNGLSDCWREAAVEAKEWL